jgi:hypothetical protein
VSLRKVLLVAVIAAIVGLFFAFDLGSFLSLDALKAQQTAIEAFRAGQPWLTAAIYFVLYVAVTALSLPGATLMTLAVLVSRFLLRDWGTERVMAQTRERLRAAGLRWCEPATLRDADRPEDLDRLAALYPEAPAFRGTIAASNPPRESAR